MCQGGIPFFEEYCIRRDGWIRSYSDYYDAELRLGVIQIAQDYGPVSLFRSEELVLEVKQTLLSWLRSHRGHLRAVDLERLAPSIALRHADAVERLSSLVEAHAAGRLDWGELLGEALDKLFKGRVAAFLRSRYGSEFEQDIEELIASASVRIVAGQQRSSGRGLHKGKSVTYLCIAFSKYVFTAVHWAAIDLRRKRARSQVAADGGAALVEVDPSEARYVEMQLSYERLLAAWLVGGRAARSGVLRRAMRDIRRMRLQLGGDLLSRRADQADLWALFESVVLNRLEFGDLSEEAAARLANWYRAAEMVDVLEYIADCLDLFSERRIRELVPFEEEVRFPCSVECSRWGEVGGVVSNVTPQRTGVGIELGFCPPADCIGWRVRISIASCGASAAGVIRSAPCVNGRGGRIVDGVGVELDEPLHALDIEEPGGGG